jgi:ribosomal protein L37E
LKVAQSPAWSNKRLRLSPAEITRSRYTRRAKRSGGASKGTASVTGHRHFHRRRTRCGRICFNRQKINLSTVFASQKVRIKQVGKEIWLVTFMDYDLGYVDHGICRLEPLENPFAAKVLPMSPE